MTKETKPVESRLRTNDMAETTFLQMHGFQSAMERDGDQCNWIFEAADGLAEQVREYRRGAARVEPKRFVREFGYVRTAMFEFLDGN